MVSAHDHGWVQPVGESVVLDPSDEAVDLLLRYHAGSYRDTALVPLAIRLYFRLCVINRACPGYILW